MIGRICQTGATTEIDEQSKDFHCGPVHDLLTKVNLWSFQRRFTLVLVPKFDPCLLEELLVCDVEASLADCVEKGLV